VLLDEFWLIAGSVIGAGGFLFIVVIVITVVVKCRKRRNKPKESRDVRTSSAASDARNSYVEGAIELFEDDRQYCTIPGAEDNNACEYYSSPGPVEPDDNKQYSVLSEADTTLAANNSPYYLTLTNEYGDCENSVCCVINDAREEQEQ